MPTVNCCNGQLEFAKNKSVAGVLKLSIADNPLVTKIGYRALLANGYVS
jgi:hypothetical protein